MVPTAEKRAAPVVDDTSPRVTTAPSADVRPQRLTTPPSADVRPQRLTTPPSAVVPSAPAGRGQHLEELSEDVARNIETIAHLQTEAEGKVGRIQRTIENITAAIARPWTLNVILGFVALWVLVNTLGPLVGFPEVDRPPFPWLQGLISFSALLVTTMVLATQSRQGRIASQRANLELQVNLVAEQKIAKLIALLEELRRDLPSVRDRVDPVANAMSESVDHEAVLTVLEETIATAEGPDKAPE